MTALYLHFAIMAQIRLAPWIAEKPSDCGVAHGSMRSQPENSLQGGYAHGPLIDDSYRN